MSLSLRLFHFENWATFAFVIVAIGLLLFGYARTRSFAFLSLALGNILFLVQVATRYLHWIAGQQPAASIQIVLTGLFLLGSLFTTIGLAALCLRGRTPTI